MKDFAITATRDLVRAAERLEALNRYADRRDQLIGALGLDSLAPTQLSRIFADDDQIHEDLAWGHLYVAHLAQMQTLDASLSAEFRRAA
ncbi:hypothetical protein [Pseudomonas sp.]|uniref:hypothetical protein n=1 Tax=Pseudomonas sp. TaxID=306 RepID=UPI003D0BD35F